MTRLSRIAVVAALLALCSGLRAQAALDPARVFRAGPESFLPAFSARAHEADAAYSPIVASLFNAPVDRPELALLLPSAPILAAAGDAATLALPQTRATFEPALASASVAPLPQIAGRLSVATPSADALRADNLSVAPPAGEPLTPPHFGAYAPYTPALAGDEASTSVPVRLGNLRFETAFAAMQHCGTADEGAACTQGLNAGTHFDVRAGDRNVDFRVESGVTHLSTQGAGVFPYVPLDPDAQAGLTYPGVTDVFGQNVGAQVAVPVTRRVTVGLQFDRTHYEGNSFTTELPGFEGLRDTYLGNVTYQLPGSSAITLSARQYRYQDLLTPALNAKQTRADLNFTVKF